MTNTNRKKATETIPAMCGLFSIPKDCLSCSNSMSDENDVLYCVLNEQHVIVQEDEVCADYN